MLRVLELMVVGHRVEGLVRFRLAKSFGAEGFGLGVDALGEVGRNLRLTIDFGGSLGSELGAARFDFQRRASAVRQCGVGTLRTRNLAYQKLSNTDADERRF